MAPVVFNLSLMTVGCAPSGNLQRIWNVQEELMHQLVVLPFRGSSVGWRRWQTGNLGNWVQWREIQSLAPDKEAPHAALHTSTLSGKQFYRERVESPGLQQIDHGPAVWHCGKDGQQPPRAAGGRVLAAGQGRWPLLSAQPCVAHLGCCIQVRALQYKRDMDILESVQQRTMNIINSWEPLTDRVANGARAV